MFSKQIRGIRILNPIHFSYLSWLASIQGLSSFALTLLSNNSEIKLEIMRKSGMGSAFTAPAWLFQEMVFLHLNEMGILMYNFTVYKNIAGIQVNWIKTHERMLLASPNATKKCKILAFRTKEVFKSFKSSLKLVNVWTSFNGLLLPQYHWKCVLILF